MSNGVLDMGKRDTTTNPAFLTLKATKRLVDSANIAQTLTDKQFSFVLLNKEPAWDAENGKFIYNEDTDTVNGAENDTDGNIEFQAMTFVVDGTFTYYLVEKPTEDSSITQDPALYRIVVMVAGTESTSGSVRKTTYNITKVEVSKDGDVIQTDSSSDTTKTVNILKSEDGATFTNKVVPSYALPSTGGVGTTLYTLGGLLLMAAAEFFLLYNHKNRRKEETASS